MRISPFKIIGLLGSTRASSTNLQILNVVGKMLPGSCDFEIFKGIDRLPHFNPDNDNGKLDENVKQFRDMLDQADAIIICTPEYVFSLPGSLKNAIEWLVSTTILSHKPGALITASTSGEKAHEALHLVMKTLELNIPDRASLLIQAPKTKLTHNGEIHDAKTLEALRELIDVLVAEINNQSG